MSAARFGGSIAWLIAVATMTVGSGCPAPPRTAAPAAPSADPGDPRVALRVQMDEAERTLAVTAGDCAAACRALGDLARAGAEMCAYGDEDCRAARAREDKATTSLRPMCATCPVLP